MDCFHVNHKIKPEFAKNRFSPFSSTFSIKFSDVRSYLRKKARKFYLEKQIEPPAKKFLMSEQPENEQNNEEETDMSFARGFIMDDSSMLESKNNNNNSSDLTNKAILAIFDMIDPVSENFFDNVESPWLRSGGNSNIGRQQSNSIKKEMLTMLKEFIRHEYRKNPEAFPPPTLQT